TPAEERKAFRLPPGFEAQLVASEPDIRMPINIAFDAKGRLWVTQSTEYPFPAKPGTTPRDTVKVLSDFGPDGKARKVTTFVDGLNIPIGVLPLTSDGKKGDEALIFSIPAIQRFRDTDGDGKADKREVVYEKYGFGDTHGMTSAFTWGLDGWIYACHGFSNTSTVQAKDGSKVTMQSGNTYRFRPDGSHIEQFTWGQVNPFGLCFDPLGNLYSADCHSQPIYQLLRGAYYPSFGKPHDGLGFGPEMINNYRGSTAICGIVYYAADHFPAPFQGSAFVGDVVTNRINQFRLEWHGSSPHAIQQDFLKSDDLWFRPVDIKLGPDGALYVADFYNRIIGHYEVPLDHPGRDRERGRIWRIVYRGADGKGKPSAPRADWTKASVKELVEDLAHPNLTVRTLATNQLVHRGGPNVVRAVRDVMGTDSKVWQRVHGLWVLERLGVFSNGVVRAAKDREFPVRVHAMRVLAERQKLSEAHLKLVREMLKDSNPHVQRAAAEALGRHPDWKNLEALVGRRPAIPRDDTHLLHALRIATRDVLRASDDWRLPFKEFPEEWGWDHIAEAALGVQSPEASRFLLEHLKERKKDDEDFFRMVHHIARYGSEKTTAALLTFARKHRPDELGRQAALVRSIELGTSERGAKLDKDARAWAVHVAARLLDSLDAGQVQAGLDLVAALRYEEMQGRVVTIALSRQATEGQRVAALNALAALDGKRHAPLLGRVLADAGQPAAVREHSAGLLARINQPESREELVKGLQSAPAPLQNVIATNMSGSREGAEQLLDAVAAGKASPRLLQERGVEVRLKQAGIRGLKERLEKLTAGLPPADQRLQDLLRRRRQGFLTAKKDVAQGQKVFEKNCAICHQLGGKGAKVGPQLDGIGLRGLDRLLEDTLDPNRNVDQAFRTTTLTLKKGQVVSGLLLKEEGAVLVLADNQGKEVRVPKASVDERSVSQLSPMPANVVDQVSEADFYHLLAYLLAQKPPDK
ncbi:MAG TPA: PVC-type heme-binding CxxCH protein, partial [Gemmataceae bacterium]|nr:PVC-type heme-binding CxxCH protein [Gemmataceae bacterium]